MKKFLLQYYRPLALLTHAVCILDRILDNTFSSVLVFVVAPFGIAAIVLSMHHEKRDRTHDARQQKQSRRVLK